MPIYYNFDKLEENYPFPRGGNQKKIKEKPHGN